MNGVPTEGTDRLNIANPGAKTIDNWTHGKLSSSLAVLSTTI